MPFHLDLEDPADAPAFELAPPQAGLLGELRLVSGRLPLPGTDWHPWAQHPGMPCRLRAQPGGGRSPAGHARAARHRRRLCWSAQAVCVPQAKWTHQWTERTNSSVVQLSADTSRKRRIAPDCSLPEGSWRRPRSAGRPISLEELDAPPSRCTDTVTREARTWRARTADIEMLAATDWLRSSRCPIPGRRDVREIRAGPSERRPGALSILAPTPAHSLGGLAGRSAPSSMRSGRG